MPLLMILITIGAAMWFISHPGDSDRTADDQQTVQPGPGTDHPVEPPPGMMRQSDLDAINAAGPRTIGRIETRPVGGYERFEKVFGDIGGTIIGEVRVLGADYPEVWTLTLEPSLLADGRDEAVTRTFVAEPGMRTFEFRDLPLAAYRMSVRAPGLASPKIELSLYRVKERPGQPGLDFINLDLTMRPMAKVEGFVRQADGDAADGLAVFLVPYHVTGSLKVEVEGDERKNIKVTTNSAGSYTFPQVSPGPWMLHIGDPLRPVASPMPVSVASADQRLDDQSLPPLATFDLIIFDHLSRPCPDVDITGYLRGAGSGSIQAKTNGVGELHLRYLTPGSWRVEAQDREYDQKGKGDFVLSPGGPSHGRIEEIQIR